jgi:serine/threonine-protein kinase
VPGVPPSIERIVQRCLEKMPSDRFASAEELVFACERVLSDAGVTSAHRQITTALVAGGLTDEPPRSVMDSSVVRAEPARAPSIRTAAAGLSLCLALIVVGGGAIQFFASSEQGAAPLRRGAGDLVLVPQRPAYLRVVADPWAHVFIDGQRVDTTPFARAIPLTAGTHYVRLEHPRAATERRTVTLMPGETILLDVKMRLEGVATPDAGKSERSDAGRDAEPETP